MRNPQHVLITGASSGIGAALTILYAQSGRHLSLHGRNGERLERVASAARQRGALVSLKVGDVTDRQGLAVWIKERDDVQPLDLVLANAGISAGTGGGFESEEQTRAVFDTNLTGVLNTIHPVLPLMAQRKRGQIALISSLASFRGFAGAAAYCASKAAVRVYGEALRCDYKPYGIEVNVVCPGFIKTPMTDVNRFPMPFMMTAEQAAQIIKDGLERNRPRIAFPFIMYGLVRFITALPQSGLDLFLGHLPRKGL